MLIAKLPSTTLTMNSSSVNHDPYEYLVVPDGVDLVQPMNAYRLVVDAIISHLNTASLTNDEREELANYAERYGRSVEHYYQETIGLKSRKRK